MADGPVIQRASERALATRHQPARRAGHGARVPPRPTPHTPVVLMGYLNPIEAMGYDAFARRPPDAGVDGVLTVDLPPEEAAELVSPRSSRHAARPHLPAGADQLQPARIERIAGLAQRLLYYVSLKGVTGAATSTCRGGGAVAGDPRPYRPAGRRRLRHQGPGDRRRGSPRSPTPWWSAARWSPKWELADDPDTDAAAGKWRRCAGHAARRWIEAKALRRLSRGMNFCMSWFEKLVPSRSAPTVGVKKAVPEGLWSKCPECGAVLYAPNWNATWTSARSAATTCASARASAWNLFLDPNRRVEIGANRAPVDRLKFKDSKKYKDRLVRRRKATGEKDALIVMRGQLKGLPVVAAAFEFSFMGGSMGSVVGERFVRGVNASAWSEHIPLVCFSASGGARMQEALFSLMQMAKTSAALTRWRAACPSSRC
jgi:hypothetical protein